MGDKRVATIIAALCLLLTFVYAQKERFIAAAKQFLASPEGGGEQNALSNYVIALEKFDAKTYAFPRATVSRILEQGFSGSETKEIEVLRSLEPILNEIWRGNEKPFVKYPPDVSTSPSLQNYLKYLKLTDCLIMQALYSEFAKRPDNAVEWFKHALIFGMRTCDENSLLTGKLISVRNETETLKSLQRFMIRQPLSKESYVKIVEFLTALYGKRVPLWKVASNEGKVTLEMLSNPQRALNWERRWQPVFTSLGQEEPLDKEEQRLIAYYIANKDRLLKQCSEYQRREEELLKKDCVEIARADFGSLVAEFDPELKKFFPNTRTAGIRDCVASAYWEIDCGAAQVLAYRATKGALPQQLTTLSEIGITAPKDPFSAEALRYLVTGNSAALYSLGPDLADNQAAISYDPTNGTISTGDIVCKF